ncbi:MAG: HEAT repeat domain-containing protein, partial [Acidimicrobiia bacterium]
PAPLRAVAARALGQIGDPAAVAALVAALSDTDHRVASNAAGAMAAMGARGTANLEEVAAGEGPPAAYAREALAFAGLATSRAQRVRRAPGSPRS